MLSMRCSFMITIFPNSTHFFLYYRLVEQESIDEFSPIKNTKLENDVQHKLNLISMDHPHNYIKKNVEKIHKINEKCIHTAVFTPLLAEKMIKLKLNCKMKVKHKERLIWNRLRIKVHWNNCEWHFVVRKHNQQHITHIWLLWQFDSSNVVQCWLQSMVLALGIGAFGFKGKKLEWKASWFEWTAMAAKFNISIWSEWVNDDDERFHAIKQMKSNNMNNKETERDKSDKGNIWMEMTIFFTFIVFVI